MEKEESKTIRCVECRRELNLGVDVLAITEGVLGPRGFVPLGKPNYICSESCLQERVGSVDVEKLDRRIP